MDKTLFVFLTVALLVIPAFLNAQPYSVTVESGFGFRFYVYGGVNEDMQATIVEALMLAQYTVGNCPCVPFHEIADVNLDLKVSIIDALIIAQYYIGMRPSFKAIKGTYLS